MKKPLVIALALLLPLASFAGGTATGTITNIYPLNTGVVLYGVSVGATGKPSCATLGNYFATDETTPAGAVLGRKLSMAAAMGKTVAFAGTGTCSAWGTVETINDANITN